MPGNSPRNKGLRGEFNSNICKLMLGKHGYKDKGEWTGSDNKPLIPDKTDDFEIAHRAAFVTRHSLESRI